MEGLKLISQRPALLFASNVFFCVIFIFFFFLLSIAFYAVDNTPEPKCHYHSLHQFSLCSAVSFVLFKIYPIQKYLKLYKKN